MYLENAETPEARACERPSAAAAVADVAGPRVAIIGLFRGQEKMGMRESSVLSRRNALIDAHVLAHHPRYECVVFHEGDIDAGQQAQMRRSVLEMAELQAELAQREVVLAQMDEQLASQPAQGSGSAIGSSGSHIGSHSGRPNCVAAWDRHIPGSG